MIMNTETMASVLAEKTRLAQVPRLTTDQVAEFAAVNMYIYAHPWELEQLSRTPHRGCQCDECLAVSRAFDVIRIRYDVKLDDELREAWPDHPDLWWTYDWIFEFPGGEPAQFAVRFERNDGLPGHVIAHPSTTTPGMVQLTQFDEDGPVTHGEWESLAAALAAPHHLSDVPADVYDVAEILVGRG